MSDGGTYCRWDSRDLYMQSFCFICHLSVFSSCSYVRLNPRQCPGTKIKSQSNLKHQLSSLNVTLIYEMSLFPFLMKAGACIHPDRKDLLLKSEKLHRASWSSYCVTMAINSISSQHVGSCFSFAWQQHLGGFQEGEIGASEMLNGKHCLFV